MTRDSPNLFRGESRTMGLGAFNWLFLARIGAVSSWTREASFAASFVGRAEVSLHQKLQMFSNINSDGLCGEKNGAVQTCLKWFTLGCS